VSRTYRKYPSVTDTGCIHKKYAKRFANKRVRKNWEISNGCNYKRLYNPYDIVDYRYTIFSKNEWTEQFLDIVDRYTDPLNYWWGNTAKLPKELRHFRSQYPMKDIVNSSYKRETLRKSGDTLP